MKSTAEIFSDADPHLQRTMVVDVNPPRLEELATLTTILIVMAAAVAFAAHPTGIRFAVIPARKTTVSGGTTWHKRKMSISAVAFVGVNRLHQETVIGARNGIPRADGKVLKRTNQTDRKGTLNNRRKMTSRGTTVGVVRIRPAAKTIEEVRAKVVGVPSSPSRPMVKR
jgi:hypothetical protein